MIEKQQMPRKHESSEIRARIEAFFYGCKEILPAFPDGVDPERYYKLIKQSPMAFRRHKCDPIKVSEILDIMAQEGFDRTEVYAEIFLMKQDGSLMELKPGLIKIV